MVDVLAALMVLVPTAVTASPATAASASSASVAGSTSFAGSKTRPVESAPIRATTSSIVRPIDLVFEGLRSSNGKVAIAIFDAGASASFPASESALRQLVVDNKSIDGQLSVRIDDLPVGEYAFAVFHDEDSSGSFKFGAFGIPREGIAFSNNPRIFFGPPSFEKARVNVGTTDVLRMEMKYF